MSDAPAGGSGTGGMRAQALNSVIWVASATWAVRLLSTATFIFVGRQLTPSAFGLVALANAFVIVLGIVTDSGFATYLIRSPRITRRLFSTGFWTSAAIGLCLAAALLLAAPALSLVFKEPELRAVLSALSGVVLVNSLASAPGALLRREFRFRQLAGRTLIASLFGSIAAIVLAALGAGVWALVAQGLASSLVSAVLVWVISPWRPAFQYSPTEMRRFLAFGGQLLLTDLLLQARDRGEEFTLAIVGGATLLGQWSVATRLVKLLQDTGTQVVNQVSTPSFARIQHDRDRLFRGYAASMASAGALIFPLMGYLTLMSRDVIPLVMGSQWTSTAPVAAIIAITACFSAFTYFDRPMFAIADKLNVEIVLVVTIVVLHLVTTIVFAQFGLQALAFALLGRNLLTLPLRQWALHRWVGVPYTALLNSLRTLAAAAISVGAAALVVVVLRQGFDANVWVRLGAAALAQSIVYVIAIRSLSRDTYDAFADLVRSLTARIRTRVHLRTAP